MSRWDLAGGYARGFDDARDPMCACALEARLFMRGRSGPQPVEALRVR
jgi:hypothetical protein